MIELHPMKFHFSNDYVFCTVLKRNKPLCKELVEVLLDVKVRDIVFIESQESINAAMDAKGIRLDVYAEDDNNTVFNLEMQTTISRNLAKRSRYYQGMIDQTLISRSEDYDILKKSYIVFICLNDPFIANLSKYTFSKVCMEDNRIALNDETVTVFLNASGNRTGISDRLQNFLDYLKTAEATDEFTAQVEEKIKEVTASSKWRREYMTLEMKFKDIREESLAQGITQGMAQGIAQGMAQGTQNTLIKLVNDGLITVKDASLQLGILEEEFEELLQKRAY